MDQLAQLKEVFTYLRTQHPHYWAPTTLHYDIGIIGSHDTNFDFQSFGASLSQKDYDFF